MNVKEFPRRRRQLMSMMGADAIAILPAAPVRLRNRDVEHDYRPDSDFYYLTGFAESDSVAVLMPGHDPQYVLFCRERDPEKEAWDGYRAGPEGAVEQFGADDAYPVSDIDDILLGMLEKCERVFYTMGAHPDFDQRLIGWINQLRASGQRGAHAPDELIALDHFLHELRLYKSRAEVSAMRRAAKIAAGGHRRRADLHAACGGDGEVHAQKRHVEIGNRIHVRAQRQCVAQHGAVSSRCAHHRYVPGCHGR